MMNHVCAKDYESANSLLESCQKFLRYATQTSLIFSLFTESSFSQVNKMLTMTSLNLWLKKVFYILFREGKGSNWEVVKDVGMSLIGAVMAFDKVGPLQSDTESFILKIF